MVRKTYSTLVAIAVAALVMVGCGKEDVTDLTETWTAKAGEVQTKLDGVKAKNQEAQTQLTSTNVANTTDSMVVMERNAMQTLLQTNMTKVSEIETQLAANSAKRDSLATLGNRAEYEAAWKAADVEYSAAITALDEIEKNSNDIISRMGNLNTAPAKTDTVANSTSTTGTTDTVAAGTSTKAEDATAKKADTAK